MTLNDGFSFNNYIFVFNAASQIPKTKVYSVIKIISFKSTEDSKIKIVLDYEIIYDNIQEIIGMPIPLNDYIKNNRINVDGNTSIPFKYLPLNKQEVPLSKQEEKDMEIKMESNQTIQTINQVIKKESGDEIPKDSILNFHTPAKKTLVKEKSSVIDNSNITEINASIENHRKSFLEKFKVINFDLGSFNIKRTYLQKKIRKKKIFSSP